MLKDLSYNTVEPDEIFRMIAGINGVNLSKPSNYFEHYETGVYRHDGYAFNFDNFIKERCSNKILNEFAFDTPYGVCDNYKQILEEYKDFLSNKDKNYVIGLTTVKRESQSPSGGWRWHKWGPYIGTQNPQHEYLYNEENIDVVYTFSIYEID